MLDLFPQTQSEMIDDATRRPVPGLEPTFGETFNAAWRENLDFSQSTAQRRLSDHVVGETLDKFYEASGQRVAFPQSPIGDDPKYAVPYGNAKRQIDNWNSQHPDATIAWPNNDEINTEVLKRSRAAVTARHEMQLRPQSWASWFGGALGDVAGSATEPYNAALMLEGAPWAAGVLRFALTEAGLGMVGQTAAEVQSFGFKRQVDPNWSIGQAAGDVAGAGVGGAVVGGGLKGLATLWRGVRGGAWPRDVIDAGHVVEREAFISDGNPFPGAEGEIAHRAAVAKANDDIFAGRAVDVGDVIPPEMYRSAENPPGAAGREAPISSGESIDTSRAGMPAHFEAPATPEIGVIRAAPQTDDTIFQEAARLQASRPDFMVAVATRDESGAVVHVRRRLDEVISEADDDLAAARELRACATGSEG